VWIPNNGIGETHSIISTWGIPYTLLVRAIGGSNCPLGSISAASTCTVLAYVSENDFLNHWTVFPNPANSKLIIKLMQQLASLQNNTIFLFNARGELIVSAQMPEASVELDLSEIPAGIYLLRVNSAAQSFSRKVILIK